MPFKLHSHKYKYTSLEHNIIYNIQKSECKTVIYIHIYMYHLILLFPKYLFKRKKNSQK